MIFIELLDSWLPIPLAALMQHPLGIAISHEKTHRLYKCELINCAILSFIIELYQHRAILVLCQRIGNSAASFTLTAERILYPLFRNYSHFQAIPIILYIIPDN